MSDANKNGRQIFSNGLTIIFVYPPTGTSLIQMHLGFNGYYHQRKDASLNDSLTVLQGIKQDLQELKVWIQENGLPDFIVGSTETGLLVRVMEASGIPCSQDVEGGAYSFRIPTEGQTLEGLFQRFNTGINHVSEYAQELALRREGRK